MDLAEEHKMLTTSPTSRYALAKSFSLRLLPGRLNAIGTDPTKSDILLSRRTPAELCHEHFQRL
jgi:hypothetical protein